MRAGLLRLGLAFVATAWADEEAAAAEEPSTAIVIPEKPAGALFFEPFTAAWTDKWKVSKDDNFNGRWKLEPYVNGDGVDEGLVVSDPARKHAVSTLFDTPIVPEGKGLVIQYELQLKNGLQCGGAYIKLLTASEELSHDGFVADTPYTIMFGPDKCGDTNKVHFILRHKSPKTGEWEEKHLVSPPMPETLAKDTHLYTAIVGTDNSVKILVDNVEKKTASLLSDTDFKPAVNPPKEIDDPDDKKPDDWIDDPKMDEPGATKPEDWDEDAPLQIADPKAKKPSDWLDDAPEMVADPDAAMPDDWDADEDGEWEAPLIKNSDCEKHGCGEWKAPMVSNPDYKGKWYAPKVDNPEYKGVWSPKQIPNKEYFYDESPHAMAPIGGIGIELWTMQDGILFDNILIATDPAVADAVAKDTFVKRKELEKTLKTASDKAQSLEDDGTYLTKAKNAALRSYYWVQDNTLIALGSLFLGLVPLILYCFWPSKAAAGDDDAPAGGGGDEDEDEGEAEEKEEKEEDDAPIQEIEPAPADPKPKGGAKKRTPKAAS